MLKMCMVKTPGNTGEQREYLNLLGVPVYPSCQGPFCHSPAGLNIICMLSQIGSEISYRFSLNSSE